MRHRKKGKVFDRAKGPREAFLRGLVNNFVVYEHVDTTAARAKAVRSLVERLVTRAKVNTIASKRYIRAHVYTDGAQKKLFEVLAPRYMTRPGGCTRITKLNRRQGDRAPISRVEFV